MATKRENRGDMRTAVSEYAAVTVQQALKALEESYSAMHVHQLASARKAAERADSASQAVLEYADQTGIDLDSPVVSQLEEIREQASRILQLVENAPQQGEREEPRR